MNLPYRIITFLIICILWDSSVYGQLTPEKEEFIRSFYLEYFQVCQNSISENELKKIESKYVNPRLRRKIKKQNLDYNVYINSQDCDTSALETLKVREIDINKFEVSYGTTEIIIITIELIERRGRFEFWKIS